MDTIALQIAAGEVSAELARRGVPSTTPVRIWVELAEDHPGAAIATAGGGFDWLTEEPDLYSDTDLIRPPE